VWCYTPSSHKTEHHDRERRVAIGPRAQEILAPWLRADPEAFLFQPREVRRAMDAQRRANRKSPMTPSQRARHPKAKPKRAPGERYNTRAYCHTIHYGIRRANRVIQEAGDMEAAMIPTWHPNQLRHNAATRLKKEFGIDVARSVLGHSSPTVTEIYAERDFSTAAKTMGQVG
jgi:integrase